LHHLVGRVGHARPKSDCPTKEAGSWRVPPSPTLWCALWSIRAAA
jgi:hypothetical protein